MGAGRGAWCLVCPRWGLTQWALSQGTRKGRRAPDGGAGFIFLRGGLIESQEGEIWEEIRERNWGENAR